MKDYLYQFYNEGLGATFYIKPIKYFKRKINNKNIYNIINIIIKFIYTILVLLFGIFTFYLKTF